MNKCKKCGKEISEKAIFCGDACRMAFKRSQPEQQPEHLPEQNEPEQPEQTQPEQVSETKVITEPYDPTPTGFCHYCNKEITQADYGENFMLVRCCYSCAEKIRKKELVSKL